MDTLYKYLKLTDATITGCKCGTSTYRCTSNAGSETLLPTPYHDFHVTSAQRISLS